MLSTGSRLLSLSTGQKSTSFPVGHSMSSEPKPSRSPSQNFLKLFVSTHINKIWSQCHSLLSVYNSQVIFLSFCIHCLKFTVSSVPKLFSSKRFNKCFSTSFKCEQLSQECNIQFRLLVLHTYFNKNCLQSVLPGIAEYNNFAFWCI